MERVDLFAPLSGRLITDKHQMGAILLFQALFFFPFLPKTKSIIKHLFRGILFRDNKFETFAFDSIYDSEKNSLF